MGDGNGTRSPGNEEVEAYLRLLKRRQMPNAVILGLGSATVLSSFEGTRKLVSWVLPTPFD